MTSVNCIISHCATFIGVSMSRMAAACASCHTANPKDLGKHIVTGRKTLPLSQLVNAKRFSDIEKVKKQFDKHCHEVVASNCTAQ